MKKEDNTMDESMYQEFISPELCKRLVIAGVNARSEYRWKARNYLCDLECFAFDVDGYYKQATANVDTVVPPNDIIPAFQAVGLSKLLPDFFISRSQGSFTISIENIYKVDTVTDNRLPDAIAKMVLECIRARVITPEKANDIINNQK
jgi:hypothetical protein